MNSDHPRNRCTIAELVATANHMRISEGDLRCRVAPFAK